MIFHTVYFFGANFFKVPLLFNLGYIAMYKAEAITIASTPLTPVVTNLAAARYVAAFSALPYTTK